MSSFLEQIAPHVTPFSRQILLGVIGVILLVMGLRIWRRARRNRRRLTPAVVRRSARKASPPAPPVSVSQPAPQPEPAAQAPNVVNSRVAFEPKQPARTVYTSREHAPATHADWRGSPIADGSDYAFGAATPMLAELLPESDERKQAVTAALRNAGYYSAHAWHNLAALRILGIILPIIACLALLVVVPEEFEVWTIIGLVALPLVGWSLPTLLVQAQAKRRLEEMNHGLPDMLDLLNMCVSQGMTVPAALARVSREIDPVYPALAKELKIVTEQARIGSLEQALHGFSKRVDTPEMHSFTSLLIQTERMGTSMSESLIEYSDSMRETFRQRADEKANSATFKMLFPTVLCLMPAVFMFLLGPAVIELNEFFSGRGQEILNNSAAGVQLVTQEQR